MNIFELLLGVIIPVGLGLFGYRFAGWFGAIGGPFLAAAVMQRFGPQMLFAFSAAIYVVLVVIILQRMRTRASVPASARGKFIALLRTSPIFARLAGRSGGDDKGGGQ